MAKKRKDDGIELSPKHGLNPMLTTCFWCGEPMGVAIVGRIRGRDGNGDTEAPRKACVSLEPCDKCRSNFEKGVLLIEVTEDGSRFGNDDTFSFGAKDGPKHLWPSGRYAVLKPEAVKNGKPGGKILCDPAVMDRILAAGKAEKAEKADKAGKDGE